MTDISVADFLKLLVTGGLCQMAHRDEFRFLSFANLAVGIELLGACVDDEPFDSGKKGLSEGRFRTGLRRYMGTVDPRYKPYAEKGSAHDLYKGLRCGMAHMMRPQGMIAFTGRKEAIIEGTEHLVQDKKRGKLILVAEQLSDDFAEACRLLIDQLPELEKNIDKLRLPYLRVG